jgi:hypothetical protein
LDGRLACVPANVSSESCTRTTSTFPNHPLIRTHFTQYFLPVSSACFSVQHSQPPKKPFSIPVVRLIPPPPHHHFLLLPPSFWTLTASLPCPRGHPQSQVDRRPKRLLQFAGDCCPLLLGGSLYNGHSIVPTDCLSLPLLRLPFNFLSFGSLQ